MKNIKKSKILLFIFCILLMNFFIQPLKISHATEKYPTKPIKFIVPVTAGGTSDVVPRMLADLVGKALGQEIIVENKVGAGGAVAARFIANSKPDGYTIGAILSSVFIITPNFTKMDFDVLTDLVPIAQVFASNQALEVAMNSPIKTFNDFIEEGRKRQILVAAMGMSYTDIVMQRLATEAKIGLKIVPYGGMSQAALAAMGGHADVYAQAITLEFIRAGKMRVIAMLSDTKGPFKGISLEGIPTLKQLGYNLEAVAFTGIFAPKGLPQQIQEKLEEEFARAIHHPSIAEFCVNTGMTLQYKNSKDYGNYLKEVYERANKEIKELGLGIYAKEKK